ncbi:MAG TPA: HDIG domain-containing protein [Candidatus Brocadiia bacterium]|nr:HDIG domain-containing protein [Candidatus Brocadiia bacterium]
MDRQQAWELLNEYTDNPSLIKHALAVEAAMRHYARIYGEDEELWAVAGLIHDFDYQRWPEPPEHTARGAEILRGRGASEEIVGAMLSHAEWNQGEYPLDSKLRRTLYAVDEMTGFIIASALVRPTRLEGLEPKSVKKRMKDKAFARAVDREALQRGAELLGISLDEHIANCIAAISGIAKELGLDKAQ